MKKASFNILLIVWVLSLLPMTQAQAAPGFSFGGNLGGELLENTRAFAISAEAVDANKVRLTWRIADGYYMYRDKFEFKSANSDFSVGKPAFPKGKIKKDLIFGKVETYRTKLSADLPVTANGSANTLKLSVTTQGCADIGVCYPPLTQILNIKMPVASAAATTTSGALSQIGTLGDSLGFGSNSAKFLAPDKAFRFDAGVVDAMTLRASWSIADGYYLYKDKFKFKLIGDDGIQLARIDLPAGKVKIDPNIGKTEIFLRNLSVDLPLRRTHGNTAKVKLVVTYQGCAEAGLCYPPQTRTIPFELGNTDVVITTTSTSTQPVETKATTSNKTKLVQSLISNLIFAFGIGVLLTFTPCVLPMIPILGSMVVGQGGEKPSKTRSGLLSFSYVMGTAVTYSAAGWLAGYSGGQLQAYTQNVWGIGIVVIILVMLSLSMFGFYEIQMPSAIQSRMQSRSAKFKGGSFTGVFFMGMISALIVGACVTPLLMLVLGIAIKAGDPALGAAMMFSLALGMGVFLVIIGVGAGHLLPKAGVWMRAIKQFFGALLIGVAIYLLTPLSDVPVLLLWSVFLIVVAVYMGATQALPENSNKWRYLWKGIGIVLLLWGVLAMLGGIVGNRDIMQPIDIKQIGIGGGGTAGTNKVETREVFIRLENTRQLDMQLAEAKISGKAVLLDYYAEWCTDCRRMEKATFDDPRVQKIMSDRFVALQVDVTDPNNDATEAIKKRYGVFGPPAMLFFDKNGRRLENINFYGFKGPDDFIALLNKI
ncbi:MAG: protein-disulfide reductase DsbD [Gammaproteobacteria bacterium]|nr:MAG: protein-disulfide reductase DsbD [Gammaproteobacteria bacterium]